MFHVIFVLVVGTVSLGLALVAAYRAPGVTSPGIAASALAAAYLAGETFRIFGTILTFQAVAAALPGDRSTVLSDGIQVAMQPWVLGLGLGLAAVAANAWGISRTRAAGRRLVSPRAVVVSAVALAPVLLSVYLALSSGSAFYAVAQHGADRIDEIVTGMYLGAMVSLVGMLLALVMAVTSVVYGVRHAEAGGGESPEVG